MATWSDAWAVGTGLSILVPDGENSSAAGPGPWSIYMSQTANAPTPVTAHLPDFFSPITPQSHHEHHRQASMFSFSLPTLAAPMSSGCDISASGYVNNDAGSGSTSCDSGSSSQNPPKKRHRRTFVLSPSPRRQSQSLSDHPPHPLSLPYPRPSVHQYVELEFARATELPLKAAGGGPKHKQKPHIKDEVKGQLEEWLLENIEHPFPSAAVKESLSIKTGLTTVQIGDFMTNFRKRKLFPLLRGEKLPTSEVERAYCVMQGKSGMV